MATPFLFLKWQKTSGSLMSGLSRLARVSVPFLQGLGSRQGLLQIRKKRAKWAWFVSRLSLFVICSLMQRMLLCDCI